MSKSLYELLGVAKDATFTQLKKAYHKKAIEKHPDKGGDDNEMAEVNLAYAVLSDPEKRRVYDETGYFETRVMTVLEEALALMGEIYSNMLGKYGEWLPYINIIEEAVNRINTGREACKKDKGAAESNVKILRQMSKALVTDEEENIIAEMLESLASGPEKTVTAAERFLVISQKALDILGKYKYTPLPMTDEQKEEFDRFMHPKFNPLDMLGELLGGGNK